MLRSSKAHYVQFAHVNKPDFDPVAGRAAVEEPKDDDNCNDFNNSHSNIPFATSTSSSYAQDLSAVAESDENRRRHSKNRRKSADHPHSGDMKRNKRNSTIRTDLSNDNDSDMVPVIVSKLQDSRPSVPNNSIFNSNNNKDNELPPTSASSHIDAASPQPQQRLTRVLFSEDGQLSVVDIDGERLTARVHKATANVDLSPIEYRMELLSHVEALECEDNNGNRPLHIAAYLGHLKHLNVLLELSADINARNNAGNTPLHLALSTNHFDVAVKLKNKGAKDAIKNLAGFPASKGSRGTSSYATAALLSAINENHLSIALNMCETLDLDHVDIGELIRCKDYVKRTLRDIWTDQHEEKINQVIYRLEDDLAHAPSPRRDGKGGRNSIQRVVSNDTFAEEEGVMASMTHRKTEAKDKKDPLGSIFGFFCF